MNPRLTRLILAMTALVGISGPILADEAESLISVKHIATEWETLKPPTRVYYVELNIRNPRSKPTWYITRYSGEKALTTETAFQMMNPWDNGCIIHSSVRSSRKDDDSWFAAIKVISDATDGGSHSFEAFLLPANGELHHSYFGIEAWAPIDAVEIWEAGGLLVDGKTPLEEWAPYEFTSTLNTRITKEDVDYWRFKMLTSRLKPGKTRVSWPSSGIKYLSPTVIKKHSLPIKIPPIPQDNPKQAEQGGADQPATAPKPKDDLTPNPEPNPRPQ